MALGSVEVSDPGRAEHGDQIADQLNARRATAPAGRVDADAVDQRPRRLPGLRVVARRQRLVQRGDRTR